jgi:hypothetical protein
LIFSTSNILNFYNPLDILNEIDQTNKEISYNVLEKDPICIFTCKNGNRNITKMMNIHDYLSLDQMKEWIQIFKKNLHCNVFIDKSNNINLQGNHILFLSTFLKDNNLSNFTIKGVL